MSARIAVLGLARSGRAAALLALEQGAEVYASDAGDTPALREAAQAVESAGGRAQLGGHDVDAIAASDLLVVSPGIPPTIPLLSDERVRGVPQVSELEYAWRQLRSRVIAITGTNGKTTTTALCAHMLREAAMGAQEAGNIGRALSDVAILAEQPEVVVVEASSFQLGGIEHFAPTVGVLTNLAPDHLDRYDSVEAYYADKARLFANAGPDSRWILNADDPKALELAGDAPGTRLHFSVRGPLEGDGAGAWLEGEVLRARPEHGGETLDLAERSELKLLGGHNIANALAAAAAALAVGADAEGVRRGLRSFTPMAHRLEPVASVDGVQWINDSKATNLESTRVALRGLDRPIVLLLGGRHKGEPYTGLLEDARGRVRSVIAYGEAGERVAADLSEHLSVLHVRGGLDEVVTTAARVARPGDAVLLSPACSSYDMFENYEERGARFKELVRALGGAGPSGGGAGGGGAGDVAARVRPPAERRNAGAAHGA